MKKLLTTLFAAGMFFGSVATIQAESQGSADLLVIIPGECFLDGIISPPHKFIDDMDGFEVPLVANWSPAEQNEETRYVGDAKFGVSNFKIRGGEPIDFYTVDIDLTLDDPEFFAGERDNLLLYDCQDVSDSCTATLVTVKAAITKQIARDYEAEVRDVIYESDASARFLGVFVKGMNPPSSGTEKEKGQIYILTEVCGTHEMTLAQAFTAN